MQARVSWRDQGSGGDARAAVQGQGHGWPAAAAAARARTVPSVGRSLEAAVRMTPPSERSFDSSACRPPAHGSASARSCAA